MKLEVLRPPDFTPESSVWKELERYLLDQHARAEQGRAGQVDDDYKNWTLNYYAIPREKVRTIPWYNASNFVVPLIRMFLDTFVARTLNIIFATQPVCVSEGYPREEREALEAYINRKALQEWQMYKWVSSMLFRGNKNGTLVLKTPWVSDPTTLVRLGPSGEQIEKEVFRYLGPKPSVIPFEDFSVYPITANDLNEVEIGFHRVRVVEEKAQWLAREGGWQVSSDSVDQAVKLPKDIKRSEEQAAASVIDVKLRELQAVECYLDYELTPGKRYSIVGVLLPDVQKLVDVYYFPYPNNEPIFHLYKPFPKEDFFYGDSLARILAQSQEEVSQIHNDRRNNSYLANAPVFKRRSGSNLPNPSTNWYPGKTFEVESMEDFDVVNIGRNYDSMLDQESYDFQLGEKLSGIGAVMQGYAGGMMGKRGIYNASGTIALMQESNQRQDTNIRDARHVIGQVIDTCFRLQRAFQPQDPVIETFPQEVQDRIKRAMDMLMSGPAPRSLFVVKASNAAANSEMRRQSHIQMAQVLSQYGQSALQMATQLANPQLNPILRLVMNDILRMQKWMAGSLLRSFDELDAEGILPNVSAAIETSIPGGGRGATELNQAPSGGVLESSGGGEAPNMDLTRSFLQALSQVPTAAGANGGGAGMEGVGF